jgi:uncharacterized membrane protein YqjE
MRFIIEVYGGKGSTFHLLLGVGFALSFIAIRIFGGTYLSIYWLYELYRYTMAGVAHSVSVYVFYALSNFILMCLQYYWLTLIIDAIVSMIRPKKE